MAPSVSPSQSKTPTASSSPSESRSRSASRLADVIPGLDIPDTGACFGDACTAVTQVPPSSDGETQTLPLLDPAGGTAGTVSVPDSVVEGSGELVVTVIDQPNIYDDTTLGSPILELLLFDESGREVTDLDDEVEICLQSNIDPDDDDICLGFLDEEENWVCEDPCLEERDEGYCGQTGTLTQLFPLLAWKSQSQSQSLTF